MNRRRGVGAAGRLAAVALAVAVLTAAWSATRDRRDSPDPGDSAALTRPAFAVPDPEPLSGDGGTRWATVERRTAAHSAPGGPEVARLAERTPERTQNLVVVLGRPRRHDGAVWVRVRLPATAHGATGWVRREALGAYRTVRTRLEVDLGARRAVLYRGARRVFSTRVGVGRLASPTPTGRFYVRVRLERYRSAFYGPLAFGLSARSKVTDWPGGGYVGIHGTNRPDLVPGAVSHGCIRMRNADILRLGELMPVGTPVTVT